MGDLSTLQSFLTNIISPESLSNLSSQMTSSNLTSQMSSSGTATLSLALSNLKYLTGNTLDDINLNKLSKLNNISITGLKDYLSGTDMPTITLSGLSTLDFSNNGMRITQEALSSLSTVCASPTSCTLATTITPTNCKESESLSNNLISNLTVCPSTNGDYDDLKTLLGSILDDASMRTFLGVKWDNKLQTNISLSNMSVLSLSKLTSDIKLSNLSIFDISQNDLTITQSEVNSLTTLCGGDSPPKCTLFSLTGNNCSSSNLTSTIQGLTANQHTCLTPAAPTPAAPTPVPQQHTNGDYTNLTKLLEGILSQEEILTFKNTLINQINSATSKTNLSLSNMSVLSLSKLTSDIKFANLSIFDISQNKLTITQLEVDSLSTLCGDNTTCKLFGSQTTNTNCSLTKLTSTNIPSLTTNQRTCPTTPPSIPTLGPPQITGLRIIDGGITLDYIRGFDCPPSTTSSLPEFFKEPMIGYWYYAFPSMPSTGISGQGETKITDDQLIKMATTLGLTKLDKPNTYFNLASGAVPYTGTPNDTGDNQAGMYGNGTYGANEINGKNDGCTNKQGDTAILQPHPPSAPPTITYKVLNIGGWGSWTKNSQNKGLLDKNQPVYWTTESINLIYEKIDDIMSYMNDSNNNYNVLSIDIEGIHIDSDNDSLLFGEAVTKICKALYNHESKKLGCMITMPGNGVTNTYPPGKSGMEWFKYVDEQYVTRICLMYYAVLNDTETQSDSIYDYIRVPFENSLMNCYPPNKLILGLSCDKEECKIGEESLFENDWVQKKFQGGISMWRKYYGNPEDHNTKLFQDHTAPGDMPLCPFKPTPAPPTPAPGQPTPSPEQPTTAPGQPTPAPPAPTPPSPTPPTPAPPAPAPPAPVPGQPCVGEEYIVVTGDNCGIIAGKKKTITSFIETTDGKQCPDKLTPGQTLIICPIRPCPDNKPGTKHVVVSGDTCSSLGGSTYTVQAVDGSKCITSTLDIGDIMVLCPK